MRTLEEVRAIRNKISELGERNSPRLVAELDKARAEGNKARAEWDKARAEYDIKLFTLLTPICPEAYYRDGNGYLAIPKNKNKDWIIPVFTGDYFSVEHKAFSIWEMPRYSCNGGEAKEVVDE